MTFEIKPNRIDSQDEIIALIQANPTVVPAADSQNLGTVYGKTANDFNYNTSLGRFSLRSLTTGINNTSTGYSSLYNNIGGNGNTAFGTESLYGNTSGDGNTSLGNSSMFFNTTGYSNVAVGFDAARNSTTGFQNVSVGARSLYSNTTGLQNIAIGYESLRNNTVGNYNTAIGLRSMELSTGDENTAIGRFSLYQMQSATGTTAIGAGAGAGFVSGYNNTFIGYSSNPSSSNVSHEITIGNIENNRFRIPGFGIDWKSSTFNFPGSILEKATVDATSATSTINYDIMTNGSVTYYTSNSSGNWTLNIRGNGSNTLNSLMSTGQSLTIAFLVTNGSTAYYQSGFQIDGSSVSPKWQGGTAPSSGNASSIDIYTITVIKTADATFTALAAQTRFA